MAFTLDDAVRLGATLRRIDASLLKPTVKPSVWFQGGEPYLDVFLELDGDAANPGQLEWFQVTVRGRALTWRRGHGVRTGNTNELRPDSGYASSKTLAEDRHVDDALVTFVRTLLGVRVADPLMRAALDELAR